jgi:Rps23 Pro-64 3,4-dihydroxylase Tpa1-like proline 4-hydroxylase
LNEDWEDGDGGELILEQKYKQQPKYGNFAVLDFLKTNPLHLVTPVLKEDSNRFAILTGILYDENYFNSLG